MAWEEHFNTRRWGRVSDAVLVLRLTCLIPAWIFGLLQVWKIGVVPLAIGALSGTFMCGVQVMRWGSKMLDDSQP